MIQEEQYLKESVGHKHCFKVPEGYFDQLTAQVMQQLPEQQQARRVHLRPCLYAAACSVAVLLIGVTYYFHEQSSDEAVADSSYYEEVADYAMIDNVDIYACISEN